MQMQMQMQRPKQRPKQSDERGELTHLHAWVCQLHLFCSLGAPKHRVEQRAEVRNRGHLPHGADHCASAKDDRRDQPARVTREW